MSTIVSELDSTHVATHPPFCEGGISCEKRGGSPADWTHEGRETTWHPGDTRMSLKLVRHDGFGRGEHTRGPIGVEMTVTDTGCMDSDGNEISVVVELDHRRLSQLLDFLRDYQHQAITWDDITTPGAYEMPASELPRRHGMTKAQRVWNTIEIGKDVGGLGVVESADD